MLAAEAGALVEPAGSGLVPAGPLVPVQVVPERAREAGEQVE